MTKPKLRCAIYTRKSSEEGLEQDFNSLDAQREAGEAYIASQVGEGWKALSIRYDDGGFSGGTMERPGLKKLMADVDAGQIDVVVVYKVDRLTRSLIDFSKIIECFDDKKVSFVSVTQSFNTTTSMGRLTLNVLLSFAQFEREVTGERIRDKIAASKAKGLWMGGSVPFGYDIDGRTLKINDNEAETVRLIYKRYIELKSVPLLYDDIEKRGIKSKVRVSGACKKTGGTTIGRGALTHILQNRIYLGEIPHRDKIHKGQHKAIVTQTMWDKVQETFKNNRFDRKPTNTPAEEEYWLTGKLFDAGGRAYTPTYTAGRHGKHYHYYAAQRLRGEKLALKSGIERVSRSLIHHLVSGVLLQAGEQIASCGTQSSTARIERVTLHRDRIVVEKSTHGLKPGTQMEVKYRVAIRNGRSEVVAPPDFNAPARPIDGAMVKAIRRAWQWRVALETGKYDSIEALATAESLARPYINKLLPIAFLHPASFPPSYPPGPSSSEIEKTTRFARF
jgi:site-specific DNA recombinase